MLVCAQSQAHADEVGARLKDEFELSADEVLVIHAKQKTERDLLELEQLEQPTSRIRVVVQVHVLDEGWDVTNVYIIAPLRCVHSFTNAKQVMGRGLRLPAGFRVNDEEVDRLDILAFGKDTFTTVYDEAVSAFGSPGSSSFEVTSGDGSGGTAGGGRTVGGDGDDDATTRVEIAIQKEMTVLIPRLDLKAPEPDLDIPPLSSQGTTMTGLDLETMQTDSSTANAAIPRRIVRSMIVDRVFHRFEALSAPLHQARIEELAGQSLDGCMQDGQDVPVDHELVAKLITEKLHNRWVVRSPAYTAIGSDTEVTTAPVAIRVPAGSTGCLDSQVVSWDTNTCKRIPIGNWRKSVHESCRFDTKPEFEMAKKLDIMGDVTAWLRNDPAQVDLPTLRRQAHAPDFVVFAVVGGAKQVLLLEIKGEHLWGTPGSEARTNARDTNLWVAKANSCRPSDRFVSALLLSEDVDRVQTYQHIRDYDTTDRWDS